jgi:hypothetical protein
MLRRSASITTRIGHGPWLRAQQHRRPRLGAAAVPRQAGGMAVGYREAHLPSKVAR